MRVDLKKTEHVYRGYQIKGRQTRTSGGYVLGGRHFVEGGITRNYLIIKDNRQYYCGCLIGKLKEAKELVDDIIRANSTD